MRNFIFIIDLVGVNRMKCVDSSLPLPDECTNLEDITNCVEFEWYDIVGSQKTVFDICESMIIINFHSCSCMFLVNTFVNRLGCTMPEINKWFHANL